MSVVATPDFKVIAIVAAFNEGDVIAQVVRDLIEQGVDVYLLDDNSNDDTSAQVEPYLGRGLLRIERLPKEGDGERPGQGWFAWGEILGRKEQLATELQAHWFIHHDADEIRESPWPGLSLRDAIYKVDRLGYNAIDFELLNFRPTHDGFQAGQDLRRAFPFYEPGNVWDKTQIKCWKKTDAPVDLASTGGHEALFPGRRVFPLRFILRHYPIRSRRHGERKVFRERRARLLPSERERGWHVQYDAITEGERFVKDSGTLSHYDPDLVRLGLVLHHRGVEELEASIASKTQQLTEATQALERAGAESEARSVEANTLRDALTAREQTVNALQNELRERSTDIEALRATVAVRERTVYALQKELRERSTDIEALRDTVTARDHAVYTLENEVRERTADIEGLQSELRERTADIEGLQNEVRERSTDIHALREALVGRDRAVDALQTELRERSALMRALSQALEDRDRTVEFLQAELRMWEADARSLQSKIKASAGELATLKHEASELAAQVGELNKLRWEFDTLRRVLEAEHAQATALTAQIEATRAMLDAVYASRSWRWMAPLRATYRLLGLEPAPQAAADAASAAPSTGSRTSGQSFRSWLVALLRPFASLLPRLRHHSLAAPDVEGYWDQASTDHAPDPELTISGWAFSRGSSIRQLALSLPGGREVRLSYGLPRPDVAQAFPGVPGADCSGFAGTFPMNGLGSATVAIWATLADGSRVRCFERQLHFKREAHGRPADVGRPVEAMRPSETGSRARRSGAALATAVWSDLDALIARHHARVIVELDAPGHESSVIRAAERVAPEAIVYLVGAGLGPPGHAERVCLLDATPAAALDYFIDGTVDLVLAHSEVPIGWHAKLRPGGRIVSKPDQHGSET